MRLFIIYKIVNFLNDIFIKTIFGDQIFVNHLFIGNYLFILCIKIFYYRLLDISKTYQDVLNFLNVIITQI